MWCEGLPAINDIFEISLESGCARIHVDTENLCRGVVDVSVVIRDKRGLSKSVAGGVVLPCGLVVVLAVGRSACLKSN